MVTLSSIKFKLVKLFLITILSIQSPVLLSATVANDGGITLWVTVGMPVARHPPYRSVRALLTHTAPTSSTWRKIAAQDKDEQYVPLEDEP